MEPSSSVPYSSLPPLPAPPRRPPPAQLPSLAPNSSAAAPMAPSLSRRLFRTRALNKATQLWSQSTDYLAPRLESAAEGIARGIHELRDEARERKAWDTPNGVLTTPKGIRAKERPASIDAFSNVASVSDDRSGLAVAPPVASSSRWGGIGAITGYFGAGARERRDQSFYSEEKICCFPGYGTLRPSTHAATEPAMVIDIFVHGYAYRLRPISKASTSQRMFYSLAKSFAALPKIPAYLNPTGSLDDAGGQSVDSAGQDFKDQDISGKAMYDHLLAMGGEGAADDDATKGVPVAEPEEMAAEEVPPLDSPILAEPAKIARRPRIVSTASGSSVHQLRTIGGRPLSISLDPKSPTKAASTSSAYPRATPHVHSPTKYASTSSAWPRSPGSGASTPVSSRPSTPSLPSSPTPPSRPIHNTHDVWPKPFAFEECDLPRLHANLQARLVPFFGQKLSGRKVRVSVYPALPSGSLWDQPLATKVVTTGSGGGFKTNVEVRSRDLRKLLDESGEGVESLDGLRVRIVMELLEYDPVQDVMTGGHFLGHQGLKGTCEDECEILVGKDGGVRVISDVDDTIKWTQVLAGTKVIFRNVFVRELDEIRVPGMAKWFKSMEALGASFHYVSNSPWELWPVVRAFMQDAGFPQGSVTLKEYGGASSAIAKLWEEPGNRKRAGVESIIMEFSDSRFILIGDSGEQDLNLYVALAQVYPERILAIYIRDVTTPLRPSSPPPSSPAPPPSMSAPSFSEFPDLPGQFDGAHESLHRASAGNRTVPSSRASSIEKFNGSPVVDSLVDPLSPNNPLRPQQAPDPAQAQADARLALIEAFYARIAAAEAVLPEGVTLRIFRGGKEVEEEGVGFVEQWA